MEGKDLTDEYIEGFVHFLHWSDGFLFFALILILADLFFGVKKARKNNEDVRRSRALRRSIDKICAYILWIIIAFGGGEVFGELFGVIPAPVIVLGVIYFIEIESIAKNYFEWRGVKVKVNLLKLFAKKTDIIELEQDITKNKEDGDTETN